jgi:hypothetical protein
MRGLGGPSPPMSSLGRRRWPPGRGTGTADVDGLEAWRLPGLNENVGRGGGLSLSLSLSASDGRPGNTKGGGFGRVVGSFKSSILKSMVPRGRSGRYADSGAWTVVAVEAILIRLARVIDSWVSC